MKKLSSYLREHSGSYLFAVFSLLVCVSLDMLSPLLTKRIIDDVITGGKLALLKYLLAGILGIGLGRCVFGYLKEYFFDITGARIAGNMRKDLLRHLQGLSADFYDRNNTGELMARVKDDIDRIWEGLTFVGMLVIEVVVHVTMILFFMYRLNWRLALIPTAAVILCGFLAVFLERKLDKIYESISEENAVLNTVAQENLAGVRTVKAFAREKYEIQKFLLHNKRYCDLNLEQSRMFVKYHPFFSFVTRVLPLLILLAGGYLIIRAQVPLEDLTSGKVSLDGLSAAGFSLGSLGAFVEYSMNIVWPMEMLGWLANSVSSAVASYKKLKKVYAETPAVQDCASPVVLERIRGTVVFEKVCFERAGVKILEDIDFTLEAGKTLGIMGATGSGKSSIIHLLQRLHDCTSGRILLDGVDVRNLSLGQLRGSIALVMQDVFLFSEAIHYNIRLGKQDTLDMEQVETVSRQAQAAEFIERLEERYDTMIGERGVGLSGGQKQRVSIARAFAKGSPILILDDSTSALDMETEHLIQQTLQKMDAVTKIIIAHRISAVRHADEILFLEGGRVAQRGTHEELLAQKGPYYETYLAQYGSHFPKGIL
ncbi:MAG: ABC transporter ATP-binding protein/permease [Clostridium sp.]|nr:ABC transporter ATP-binding protein/permease [Clostridium sp.]